MIYVTTGKKSKQLNRTERPHTFKSRRQQLGLEQHIKLRAQDFPTPHPFYCYCKALLENKQLCWCSITRVIISKLLIVLT